jgi:hypothetical protein
LEGRDKAVPRLTLIDEVLFPVEEHPVFVSVVTERGERRIAVPEKKAIVHKKTNRVLGVVSRGYRLVTNEQALEWAYQCCQVAFPETKPSEWEVKATDAPGTGGHCFIDVVHNSAALDFKFVPANDRPDVFGPFIRVTNSYNALRALAFDIGFLRKVCNNGLILPESVVRFKFNHLKKDIENEINFEVAQERLYKLKTSFNEYLGVLRDCKVAPSEFEPLFRGVLLIRKPKDMKPDGPIASDWGVLSQHMGDLCSRYREDLGENAYAVFNAITEFASHPPKNRCIHRDRHSFQRLAGEWMSNFSQESRQTDFNISEYLERLNKGNGNGGEKAKGARSILVGQ